MAFSHTFTFTFYCFTSVKSLSVSGGKDGEEKDGWDWSFLSQIGLADLTEDRLGSKAVAPGSPVAYYIMSPYGCSTRLSFFTGGPWPIIDTL